MDNDYQQQDEYRRWLADPEAQAEYERWLTTLDKDIARKVQDQLDSFDWFGLEERN